MAKTFLFATLLILAFSCKLNAQNNSRNKTDNEDIKSELGNQKDITSLSTSFKTDTFYFDKIIDSCLNNPEGQTTVGMIECFYYATSKLEILLDETYANLYSKLDKEDKQKLKLSQDNWTKFKECEADFLYSVYYTWTNYSKYGHGREHSIIQAEWRYNIVRERLINLIKYDEDVWIEE